VSINRAKVLKNAQKFLAKGQIDKAIAEYMELVKDQPKDARTLLKVGDLYTRKGDTKEACGVYHRVASQYGDQGFFLKAVAVYKQILKLDANQPDALERLAEMYEMLSLVSDAHATYEQLVDVYERDNEAAKQLETLEKMMRLDPDNVPAHIRYAETLSSEGRAEEAAESFEEGARLLEEQGRMEDYLKVAERLLYHRPTDLELARKLAEMYLERGDAKHALSKLQPCFKANPKDIPMLELLAQAFELLGDVKKTVSVLREVAGLHSEAGSQHQRIQVLKKILEVNPGDPRASKELDAFTEAGAAGPEAYAEAERAAAEAIKSSIPAALGFGGEDEEAGVTEESTPVEEVEEHGSDGWAAQRQSLPTADERERVKTFARPPSTAPEPPPDVPPEPGPPDEEEPPAPGPTIDAQIKRLLSECDVWIRYGLTDKTIAQLDRILDMDPQCEEARVKLKNLHLKNDNQPEAMMQLFMLAELKKEDGPEQAVAYLREALELDPNNEGALAALHELEERLGTLPSDGSEEEEDEVFFVEEGDEEVVELEEEGEVIAGTEAAVEAGGVETAEDEPETAEEHEEEEIPEEVADALEEIEFYRSQGLAAEALNTLAEALASFPDSVTLQRKRRELAGEGEQERIRLEREEPPEERPGQKESHYDLGLAYMEMELHENAIKEFKQCLDSPKLQCHAHTMIGLCLVARGEIREAVAHYEKGLASPHEDPEETELCFELGHAHELLRMGPEALEYYRKVAEKDPGFRDVKRRIDRLSGGGTPDAEIDEFDVLFDDLIVKD
jgi:tetratricopeptide (TPR) repeat protein